MSHSFDGLLVRAHLPKIVYPSPGPQRPVGNNNAKRGSATQPRVGRCEPAGCATLNMACPCVELGHNCRLDREQVRYPISQGRNNAAEESFRSRKNFFLLRRRIVGRFRHLLTPLRPTSAWSREALSSVPKTSKTTHDLLRTAVVMETKMLVTRSPCIRSPTSRRPLSRLLTYPSSIYP